MTVLGSNGNDTVAINGGAGGAGSGAINGNVTLQHTYGSESVGINTLSTGGLTIGGTTNIITQYGSDTVALGSSSVGTAPTQFLGDVDVSGFNTVLMSSGGQLDTYSANVNVSMGVNANQPLFMLGGMDSGETLQGMDTITVAGNLNITGGSGNIPVGPTAITAEGFPADTTFGNQIVLGNFTVYNNLNVTVGSTSGDPTVSAGNNFFTSSFGGITTVYGNQNYTSGQGVGVADVSGEVIYGNANFNLGNGINYLGLEQGIDATQIGGNVLVNQSGGTLYAQSVLTPNAQVAFVPGTSPVLAPNPFAPVQAQIGGNLQFNVQNTDLTLPIDSAFTTIGGVIGVNAGNGTNNLTFANSGTSLSPLYDLNYRLGNGVNTVSNTDANVSLTGSVIAGTNPGNTFFNAGNFVSPWTLAGF